MMSVHEHRYSDRRIGLTLMDGRRTVATVRPLGPGYLVKGRSVCLLDKPGGPLARDKFGQVEPTMASVQTANAARRIIERLAATGKSDPLD